MTDKRGSTGRGGVPQAAPNDAALAELKERAFRLKAEFKSYRAIGAAIGVSHETARRYVLEECRRIVAPAVEDYRTAMNEQLDVMEEEAGKLLLLTPDPELKLKALTTLTRILDRRAKLNGADAAVKVDVSGTVKTQQEAELEELFAEADARNAAARAEIDAEGARP